MKTVRNYITVLIGIALLAAGFWMLKSMENPSPFFLALPYVCIGLGCGSFGHGMGNLIVNKAVKGDPNIQKQIEIEKKDERNIAISSHAKAKAYDIMIFVFGALLISFALMGVDLIPVLLLVFAYLYIQGCAVYYRLKYARQM